MITFFEFFSKICIVAFRLLQAFTMSHVTLLGSYQLLRLYHCFANHKVYTKRGYPRWLFIFMFGVGIVLLLTTFITPWITFHHPEICGINDNLDYYESNTDEYYLFIVLGVVSFITYNHNLINL